MLSFFVKTSDETCGKCRELTGLGKNGSKGQKHVRTLGNDKPILYLPKKLVKKIGKKIKGNLVKIQYCLVKIQYCLVNF